jgi:hypothetical protein
MLLTLVANILRFQAWQSLPDNNRRTTRSQLSATRTSEAPADIDRLIASGDVH